MNNLRRRAGLTLAAILAGTAVLVSSTPSSAATKKTTKTTKKRTKTTKAAPKTTAAGAAATSAPATTRAPSASSPYGKKSDTLYEGKGDFKLDLSKCPRDYNVNQGITSSEIKLFQSLPRSGPAAAFGPLAEGEQAYFKYVNDQGGIAGRKITLEFKDDVYDPARTKANVTDAVQSGKYAALFATLGTPNNLAVWDDTNKECMPQLLNATGAVQWGDVDRHPWTTIAILDYATEAVLWAEWLKQEYPQGAKVAMLTFNSDFGHSYSKAFRLAIKGTKLSVVKEELHEPTAPNLTNQFTNLEAALPEVVLLQTTGAFCTQSMAELERRGYKGRVVLSSTCQALSSFFQPLIGLGLTGKDTYIVQYVKDINDREFAEDQYVKLVRSVFSAQGLDPNQSTYATGWQFAWFMTEILKEAATYDGGLNRANIMLAARGIDKPNPLGLPGCSNKMNGVKDAYLAECGRIARYKVTDPKQLGTYFAQSDVFNKDGELGTYKKYVEAS